MTDQALIDYLTPFKKESKLQAEVFQRTLDNAIWFTGIVPDGLPKYCISFDLNENIDLELTLRWWNGSDKWVNVYIDEKPHYGHAYLVDGTFTSDNVEGVIGEPMPSGLQAYFQSLVQS